MIRFKAASLGLKTEAAGGFFDEVSVESSFWVDYQGPVALNLDWFSAELEIDLNGHKLVSGKKDVLV